MGRSPCCSKEGLNRGAWTPQEDKILTDYIKAHSEGKWRNLPKKAGLKRCGKSCRLRWLNYLRPDIKRGNISPDEEELIVRLHKLLGNRWSLIAGRLPGRTDNEIKNYWNTILGRKIEGNKNMGHARRRYSSSGGEGGGEKVQKKSDDCKVTPNGAASSHSLVVRTKAFKCTKVTIDQRILPHGGAENYCNHKAMDDNDGEIVLPGSSLFNNGMPLSTTLRENISHDLTLDFQMEDLCLSDFLNFEFLDLCDGDYDFRNKLSPSLSQQPGSMLQDLTTANCDQPYVPSNLNAFTPFLDSGSVDWQPDHN